MNKKMIGIIIAVVALCAVSIGVLVNRAQKSENATRNPILEDAEKQDGDTRGDNSNIQTGSGKVLVVYFSATNNTKSVAEKLAKNLDGDIFEIVPKDEYTTEDLNYSNPNSRVSKEHDDESLWDVPLKTTKVDNWESYDTVLIGYPIWWGVAAWPVDTFVKANDFDGKTVIPFCTSASSGLGQSGKLLEDEAKGGNWLEGYRFSSRPSDPDIKAFADRIE